MKKRLVAPQTLKGFQDHLPAAMIARNAVVERIRRVFEQYGFVPVDTPVLEYLTTLIGTGGEETNKQLFRLESPEREPIAMRFDLTVPFARLVAQYLVELKLPLRRYHLGPVFRADKPDPGRYRQFTQFDIDAAGSDAVAVDAEIIAAMCEAMRALGLETGEFIIKINNRKLVDALLEGLGLSNRETQKHVLRVVDKLGKIGVDNVRRELGRGRVDESGDPIKGVGLDESAIAGVLEFIALTGSSRAGVLAALTARLPSSEASTTALAEMRDLDACLAALGVAESDAVFAPSLTRGLDYYTGPVFEITLPTVAGLGSVMGGGRYDHLVERFHDTPIPGTGASIGLDRLMLGLEQLGKVVAEPTTTRALVIGMKGVPAAELLKLASELRAASVATEVYFGPSTKMRDQLALANERQIPLAIIVGDDELKNGTVSVKNLRAGLQARAELKDHDQFKAAGKAGQVTVAREELIATVQEMLA